VVKVVITIFWQFYNLCKKMFIGLLWSGWISLQIFFYF
jgi:hypothetical protein